MLTHILQNVPQGVSLTSKDDFSSGFLYPSEKELSVGVRPLHFCPHLLSWYSITTLDSLKRTKILSWASQLCL